MKLIIQRILEHFATKLLAKHKPRLVAVVGSIGKTSTKSAIATVLGKHFKVLSTEGNYNTEVVVPLQLFGVRPPENIKNPFSWLVVFWRLFGIYRNHYDYEVVVLELGVDKPGDMSVFMRYLTPDITVVTAISLEHMEQFGTLEAVAREELSITGVSKLAIYNLDDTLTEYEHLCAANATYTYGFNKNADYQFKIEKFSVEYGFEGRFLVEGLGELPAQLRVIGEHAIKPIIAAVAVATELGVPHDKIASAVEDIQPVNGRMNLLPGAEKSILIDDSYNSSPVTAIAALKTLYEFKAAQRIAILGSMNELGEHSPAAHKEVGAACDPKKLAQVVTVGEEAEKYLAPAAKEMGCEVHSFGSPYDAGAYVRGLLHSGTAVLIKGSQNRVFTEEATKLILANHNDEKLLVRQSPRWIKVKQQQFSQL